MLPTVLLVAAVVVATVLGFTFSRRWRAPQATGVSGPLPQAAYLWQRQWTEPVREAAKRALGGAAGAGGGGEKAAPLSGLCVLCAEIGPAPGSGAPAPVAVTRVNGLDWGLLAGLPGPVGLAVRVRAFPGEPVEVSREPFPALRRTLDEMLARAEAAGLRPAEIQVDFDCPAARLPGYAAWLDALRAAYPGQSFHPTAPSAWLASPDFAPLARAAGGYVLQVHGLDRAGLPDRRPPPTLCDPAEAADAVERAAQLGVPFRVALPTAGYRLILDAGGRLVSAASETTPAAERLRPPPGGSEQLLLPDAREMAGLIADWTQRRPAALQGILWNRLPVAGERLDWPWPTFAAVRAGRVPRGRLQWSFPPLAEGSDRRDLALLNVGDADAPLPPLLTVSCPEVPITADAVPPYELQPPGPKERRSPRDLRFRLRGSGNEAGAASAAAGAGESATPAAATTRRTLAPGVTLLFGWVRLPATAEEPAPGSDELPGGLDEASAAPASPER